MLETNSLFLKNTIFFNFLSVRHVKHTCDPDSALGPSILGGQIGPPNLF